MEHTARYIWMDGELVDADRAQVPFLTAGLHYGAGVVEGIRSYETLAGAAVFRLAEHLNRLLQSAEALGLPEPAFGPDDLAAGVRETVRASGMDACYIRPLVYLGDGGWDLTFEKSRSHVGIAVWRWDAFLGDQAREFGVRAGMSLLARRELPARMRRAKIAGHYADAMLAKHEARGRGFDEAIMLDPQGRVAECTSENLFLVRHNAVSTPPAGAILEGLTRDTLIVLARDLGLSVVEASVTPDELYAADEVFVCGTAAEVVAVREVEHRAIGNGRTGPITRRLQAAYAAATHGRHPRSPEWLDYLDTQPAGVHESIDIGYGHGV